MATRDKPGPHLTPHEARVTQDTWGHSSWRHHLHVHDHFYAGDCAESECVPCPWCWSCPSPMVSPASDDSDPGVATELRTDPCCSRAGPGTGHCFTQIFIHGLTRAPRVPCGHSSAGSVSAQSVLDSGAVRTWPRARDNIARVSGSVSQLTPVSPSDKHQTSSIPGPASLNMRIVTVSQPSAGLCCVNQSCLQEITL